MNKAYVFLKRGWITFTSYKMEFLLNYAGLFVMVTIFYFVAEMLKGTPIPSLTRYGGNYTSFIMVGIVFQWFISASLRSFSSSIRSEQMMGTLEFLLVSKTRLSSILFYSAVWSFARLLINTIIFFISALFIFGINFSFNILAALIVLFLTVVTLSGIGMMSAGMILAYKQGDPINWMFATLSGLLSGVYFPVEVFPSYLKVISIILPTTYALHALRQALILNVPLGAMVHSIAVLIISSFITLPAGFFLFRWGFNKARVEGSLAQY